MAHGQHHKAAPDALTQAKPHDRRAHMVKEYKRRFSVCLAFTVLIPALSLTVQSLLGCELVTPGTSYVLFALATGVYAYGGWPFPGALKRAG